MGVEALIRWRHPEKGLLTPNHFMSIVERSDLIWQVGNWVIRTACRAGHAWPELSVAVNVSRLRSGTPISPACYIRSWKRSASIPAAWKSR